VSRLLSIMNELGYAIEAVVGPTIQVVPRMNLHPSGVSIDIVPADPFRETSSAGFGETSGKLVFTVRVRTDVPDELGSQDAILALMDDEDASCVAAALQDDQTLNGLASSVEVDGPSGYRFYGDNPGAMLGVEWRVTVLNLIT
jgi:hypothetical protein